MTKNKLSPTQRAVIDRMAAGKTLHISAGQRPVGWFRNERGSDYVREATLRVLVESGLVRLAGSGWDRFGELTDEGRALVTRQVEVGP